MSKKYIYSLLLVGVLFGFSILALKTHRVEAQLLTVYIRANGDVEPSWVPIQRNGDVYTFTGDIIVDGDATGMIIERDNMTLDGAGYSFTRSPSLVHAEGIELTGRSNVTIKNLEVEAFWDGIVLWNSSNNTIQGNSITANSVYGIALWNFSNYNTISGNNITANDDNGIGLDLSSNNLIHNNTVTANGQDGIVLDAYSDNNTISRNKVTNNGYGIELYDSSNNTIFQNNLTGNTNYGLLLYYSSYNIVSENNVTTSDVEGIFLSYSHFNLVNGNHVENNGNGLTVGYGSSNNSICENEITNNEYGIQVISSSNNTFCHNNLVNNTNQVASSNSVNRWDCGYPSGGNYWSDYEERYPNATEIDGSGIWDTPYSIDENNQDNYPLMNPWRTRFGWIEGKVTDVYTGLPLEGATVTVDGYSDLTNASGFYRFELFPGTYNVTAEMKSYVSATAIGTTITANMTTTQDFSLLPSIESSEVTGNPKDTFFPIDEIYVTGFDYSPSTTYHLYVVEDVATWIDGMAIPPRVNGTATAVSSDASGYIPPTLVWGDPLAIGKYDIVVDVNNNSVYDDGIDDLDDSDIEVTAGFHVIPEFPTWTLMLLILIILTVAMALYKRRLLKTPIH